MFYALFKRKIVGTFYFKKHTCNIYCHIFCLHFVKNYHNVSLIYEWHPVTSTNSWNHRYHILTTCRPLSLRNHVSYNHETVARSTRQSSHLSFFRPKNNNGKRCFIYRASKLYNSVAMHNGLSNVTVHSFKSRARVLVQRMRVALVCS